MSGKIESLLKQISEAASDVIGMIQSIDAKIQALNAQRQAINDAPVGRSDFVAYIGRWIDQSAIRAELCSLFHITIFGYMIVEMARAEKRPTYASWIAIR